VTIPTRIAVGLHSGDSEITDLQRAAQSVLDAINNLTWNNLTLINGWTNFGGAFQTAQYALDILGFVHLRGLITNVAGQAANISCANLPAGFRPLLQQLFWSTQGAAATGARVDVLANGDILPSVNVVVAALEFRSLSGITFDLR
jgi:hypothetical protein